MKSKGRPQTGADPEGQPPPEVIDRLAGLLPEGALEEGGQGPASGAALRAWRIAV